MEQLQQQNCKCMSYPDTRSYEVGYFGLGPGATRAGDLCCIIFGSPVPLILRRADENYQLVGEAYVHGVMNGKAVGQLDQGKSQAEYFKLR
jgi:hypothetical protein